MKKIMTTGVPIYIWDAEMEESAIDQAKNVSKLPFMLHHVAVMPDGHLGYGVPIGCVIATRGAVLPYAVGNDIGCGVLLLPTPFDADSITKDQLLEILKKLSTLIPRGNGAAHSRAKAKVWSGFDSFRDGDRFKWLDLDEKRWIRRGLGTLGGGNHFIELQKALGGPNEGKLHVMIHSGSRNLGAQICTRYHQIAKKHCKTFGVRLPDPNLAYLKLDDPLGKEYLWYMNFALSYARENRDIMAAIVKVVLTSVLGVRGLQHFGSSINVHHNYAALESHYGNTVMVHRKGAIYAGKGAIGLIPGSQGTASYVVKGKGSENSFNSCSHGSGRAKGRNDACRTLSAEEESRKMDGIVTLFGWGRKKIKGKTFTDLSEAPGAYKDIEDVISFQEDLVEVVFKLIPLASLKG